MQFSPGMFDSLLDELKSFWKQTHETRTKKRIPL